MTATSTATTSNQAYVGDLRKLTKHTKRWNVRNFKCSGTSVTYSYPEGSNRSGECCFSVDADSEAIIVKNGSAIRLTVTDSKGKKEAMFLKIPKVEGLSTAGKTALYSKWLAIFRESISIAELEQGPVAATTTSQQCQTSSATSKPKARKMRTKYGTYFPSPSPKIMEQVEESSEISTGKTSVSGGYFVAGLCVGAYLVSAAVLVA